MEKLMHYIWRFRLWNIGEMCETVDGRKLFIIDSGVPNADAGPDFFNAKIRIDDQIWVGNVEIHVMASDWFKHHHDTDPAYDSVILHVVEKDDIDVHRKSGAVIPQVVMPCVEKFGNIYNGFVNNTHSQIPCIGALASVDSIVKTSWIEALAYERMNDKTERIYSLLSNNLNDWEQTCFVSIARSLGFGVNNDAFERIAVSLPLQILGKHSDSLLSVEALLFGQAGLLNEKTDYNPYYDRLKSEYDFFVNKFQIRQPQVQLKMARMRPPNFPHRRLALLAKMCFGGFKMMSKLLETSDVDEVRALFDLKLSGFWENHYNFKAESSRREEKAMSSNSIDTVIINAIVPLMIAYYRNTGNTIGVERSFSMLDDIKAENNSIVETFTRAGIKCKDAFTSQALIQLKRQYCELHKCLYCRFGHRILSNYTLHKV